MNILGNRAALIGLFGVCQDLKNEMNLAVLFSAAGFKWSHGVGHFL